MQPDIILREVQFKAVRSSGPGGQHVNKTSSKIEVYFDVFSSEGLSSREKERLKNRLSSRLTSEGILQLQSSESRSQHRNKKLAIDRLMYLLEENLKVTKPRKKTRPSRGAVEKRLKIKKQRALKKTNRKPPSLD